ncbi:uncharacterized protein isoform X3 [Danio rerio]|uniref:Uncharacterized protein isoform X3 n=1 Tax=Danio rerio TaxID=7955 RepID=A0AC58FXV7_DANRE
MNINEPAFAIVVFAVWSPASAIQPLPVGRRRKPLDVTSRRDPILPDAPRPPPPLPGFVARLPFVGVRSRMAGSGAALRIHEFRDNQNLQKQQPTHAVHRQGRDVIGLYPGQIGRVHAVSSHLDRMTLKAPDLQCYYECKAGKCFQRANWDQLALQASLLSERRETHPSNSRNAQKNTGFQKFTLYSHPKPLEEQQR